LIYQAQGGPDRQQGVSSGRDTSPAKSLIRNLGFLNVLLGGAFAAAGLSVIAGVQTQHASPTTHGLMQIVVIGIMGSIAEGIVKGLGLTLGYAVLVASVPGLVGGIGLLGMKRWSRIFMIAVSAFQLPLLPIGTLLGSYGIWCLTRPKTKALFHKEGSAESA
jgi:hypothetical protein